MTEVIDFLLGKQILHNYLPRGPQGMTVVNLLIVACLFRGYHNRLLKPLNAIHRPVLAFRGNAVFVVSKVTLVYFTGGSVCGTTATSADSLVLRNRDVNAIPDFDVPLGLSLVSGQIEFGHLRRRRLRCLIPSIF